jgi:hypothetical protein
VISSIIAGAVLVIGIIVLLVTRRAAVTDIAQGAQAALITGEMSIGSADEADAAATLAAIEAVGVAMIDAGYSVETIEWVLADIARVNNLPESGIIAFPNALMVSAKGSGQHRTGAVPSGDGQLLFHQIDEVQRTVDAARTGVLEPEAHPPPRGAGAGIRRAQRCTRRAARGIVDRRRCRGAARRRHGRLAARE